MQRPLQNDFQTINPQFFTPRLPLTFTSRSETNITHKLRSKKEKKTFNLRSADSSVYSCLQWRLHCTDSVEETEKEKGEENRGTNITDEQLENEGD
ncbi:hypothetical protein P8452_22129 [Trifolium repens]|nr:hypothetical protein P8452_22129 [Trifolium repens]